MYFEGIPSTFFVLYNRQKKKVLNFINLFLFLFPRLYCYNNFKNKTLKLILKMSVYLTKVWDDRGRFGKGRLLNNKLEGTHAWRTKKRNILIFLNIWARSPLNLYSSNFMQNIFKKINERLLRKVCYRQRNGWPNSNSNDLVAKQANN